MKVLISSPGIVYLVGAGPGDPDLLTLRGAGCLAQADVVVYDRLVDPRLLDMAREEAERIAVGKKGGRYCFPQDEINQLLVRRARRGQKVVRLKGGDPYLFGRGSEEAIYLLEKGVPFEVVPGVSSALAAPAAAGIPLTRRGVASSVAFVTGHQAADPENPVRWDLLAQSCDTLVVLMPLSGLRSIVSRLVLHGRPLDTPAALIQSATWKGQKQVSATLKTIVSRAHTSGIQSPALLVVGDVVEVGRMLQGLRFPPAEMPSHPRERESLHLTREG